MSIHYSLPRQPSPRTTVREAAGAPPCARPLACAARVPGGSGTLSFGSLTTTGSA